MTFTHKLSARLALLRNVALVAILAMMSCKIESRVALSDQAAKIVISPSQVVVSANQTADLYAVALDAAGDTASTGIMWSTTGGSVTETATGGRHRGRYQAPAAPGQYKVKARANPGSAADSATVTVSTVSVASLTLSPPTAGILVGAVQQFTAAPLDSAGNPLTGRLITWVSSDPGAATVSSSGLATGVSAGTTTIVATSESQSATATVTVSPVPVASVTVSPSSPTIRVGTSTQLTAVPMDASGAPLSGRVVTWATSDAAVATVNASGLVSSSAVGSATITATSEGQSGTSTITVTNVPVATVTVSPASATIGVGGTQQLSAVTKDSAGNALTGRVLTWSSSNTAVASVNASGLVSAVAAGSATITATSEGKSGSAAITVNIVPVASVTVSPASASIFAGATQQLAAVTKDAAGNILSGRVVTWASSNTAIARVSTNGLVTGVAAGSATITATSEGKNGTAAITVVIVPVASVTVSPATATIVVTGTQQFSAVTKDSAGTTLTGRVVAWASSNTAIAMVSASGLVTGVAVGSVTITATSEGKSGSAAVTVQTQPTVSGDTITLQIVRMDGGSGSAVVSSGIPLPKGKLTSSNIAHVVLLVAGVEQAIHVEALAGTWPDGSIRSLLVQFPYTVSTGNPIAALLIMGPSVTRSTTDLPKTTVTGNMPAAVALPTSPSYLVSTEVVGQTITRAASPTTPAAFPAFETHLITYGNSHWA
ncbi:MAG TPA: Ig-like domain-containing protein, partial [Mycobacterium sp.]|nr:Ig-like domain-containing protein [Mycobacterium sp.]